MMDKKKHTPYVDPDDMRVHLRIDPNTVYSLRAIPPENKYIHCIIHKHIYAGKTYWRGDIFGAPLR